MKHLIEVGTALALGIGVGAVFALARLPVPAPGTAAEVAALAADQCDTDDSPR